MNIQGPWISRKKHEFAVDALKYIHEQDISHRDTLIEDLRDALKVMGIELKIYRETEGMLITSVVSAEYPADHPAVSGRRGGFRTKAAAAAHSTLPAAPDSISELEHRTKSQGGKV